MDAIKSLILFFTLFATAFSYAAIRVNTLRVNFTAAGERYHDIFVKNIGNKTEYVDVQPFKRIEPSINPNKKIEPKGDPRQFGLVVTPRKMAISPGQSKRVRLLNLTKPSKTEQVYGIHIKPVKSPLERDNQDVGNSAAGVRVIAAFIVGVYIMPPKPVATVTLKREGKMLYIHNTGNINALLDQGKQCKDKQCESLEAIRIYANSKKRLPLKKSLPVTYQEVTFNTKKDLKSN